jgi:hypothetical protein
MRFISAATESSLADENDGFPHVSIVYRSESEQVWNLPDLHVKN